MIHYHGTPITPRETLYELAGRNFCVSFAEPRDARVCHEIGQSVMLDNGAYTAWRQGGTPDWNAWAAWVEPWLDHKTTWCVLPDAIDGGAEANDLLLQRWGRFHWPMQGAPVWHLDEPLARLERLARGWGRICLGSSGAYRTVGSESWHRRMEQAFDAIAEPSGRVDCWVHMLRGLSLAGSVYPFSSADSSNAARNFKGSWRQRARPLGTMVAEIDGVQCPARWIRVDQLELLEGLHTEVVA